MKDIKLFPICVKTKYILALIAGRQGFNFGKITDCNSNRKKKIVQHFEEVVTLTSGRVVIVHLAKRYTSCYLCLWKNGRIKKTNPCFKKKSCIL